MIVSFGKYEGKTAELLVLKHPDYVRWLKSQNDLKGAARALRDECVRLIAKFNSMSFIKPCSGCKRASTRTTFYAGNVSDCYSWCSTCDPYSAGAVQGKLSVVKTYEDALLQASLYHSGKVTSQRSAVQTLAKAKGLGKSVTEKQASLFFAQ